MSLVDLEAFAQKHQLRVHRGFKLCPAQGRGTIDWHTSNLSFEKVMGNGHIKRIHGPFFGEGSSKKEALRAACRKWEKKSERWDKERREKEQRDRERREKERREKERRDREQRDREQRDRERRDRERRDRERRDRERRDKERRDKERREKERKESDRRKTVQQHEEKISTIMKDSDSILDSRPWRP